MGLITLPRDLVILMTIPRISVMFVAVLMTFVSIRSFGNVLRSQRP